MAAKGSSLDQYANVAAISIVETGADILTAAKFAFPFSIMDKVGLLISRIEYWFNSLGQLNSTTDYTAMALTVAATVADITNMADPLIVDSMRAIRADIGTASSGLLLFQPFTRDFSTLPGGGLLVAPNPLYAVMKGLGEGGASSGWMRMYYTYMTLQDADYWQLVESRRIISN